MYLEHSLENGLNPLKNHKFKKKLSLKKHFKMKKVLKFNSGSKNQRAKEEAD